MMLDKGPGCSDSYSKAARGPMSPVWTRHALDALHYKLGFLIHGQSSERWGKVNINLNTNMLRMHINHWELTSGSGFVLYSMCPPWHHADQVLVPLPSLIS